MAVCGLGYTVRNYMKPLIQLLTNDLPSFNMELRLSKCLNTSVALVVMALGMAHGTRIAEFCSVTSTRQRSRDGLHDNVSVLARLGRSLKRKTLQGTRRLHYVLLTDAWLDDDVYFPGHVFIIERTRDDRFLLYQSYINQYDLNGHVVRNQHSFEVAPSAVSRIVEDLDYILARSSAWDDRCVAAWKALTHVDTSSWKGTPCGDGKILICAETTNVSGCMETLEAYVDAKRRDLKGALDSGTLPKDAVYGDETAYAPDAGPLTNAQMLMALDMLLVDIRVESGRFSVSKKQPTRSLDA